MMCEHEFNRFVIGAPTTWGLQAVTHKEHCVLCGKTRAEVNLEQQLAAAKAEMAELKAEKEREAVKKEQVRIQYNELRDWNRSMALAINKANDTEDYYTYDPTQGPEQVNSLVFGRSVRIISEWLQNIVERAEQAETWKKEWEEHIKYMVEYCGKAYLGTPADDWHSITWLLGIKQYVGHTKFWKERTEQAEKNFEDAKDKIAMMGAEIVRLSERAEQAEAQCAAMQAAINRYVLGHIELLGALKAALEEKP